ncbi:MobA/MobL family protein [Candidatus Synechococcus calcipolaris G9]|uniref:MobA/MobL family protein n=2 Tax=Synechococcus TaxID=1129 RepID=A0ABT6F2D6_9SYNE|nr:MobA/MobL family protein [Candidatus Synechococcus calcipolaris G9]
MSRSKGRNAVAAAAYRAGAKLTDHRKEKTHDYTRKRGVIYNEVLLPKSIPLVRIKRELLWNLAEESEKRINSCVAREIQIGLPAELDRQSQIQLARQFTKAIMERYQVAADLAIHEPNKKGDQRNVHAHIMFTTRQIEMVDNMPALTRKTNELDSRKTGSQETHWIRQQWEELANEYLAATGSTTRVDRRRLKDQGIEDRLPQKHLGVAAIAIERKTGENSRLRQEWETANHNHKSLYDQYTAKLAEEAKAKRDADAKRQADQLAKLEAERQAEAKRQADELAKAEAERLAEERAKLDAQRQAEAQQLQAQRAAQAALAKWDKDYLACIAQIQEFPEQNRAIFQVAPDYSSVAIPSKEGKRIYRNQPNPKNLEILKAVVGKAKQFVEKQQPQPPPQQRKRPDLER